MSSSAALWQFRARFKPLQASKKTSSRPRQKAFIFGIFFLFLLDYFYILFFSIISSIVLLLFLALVGHVWYYFDPFAQLGGLYISLITKSLILSFYILDFISKWAGPTKTYWCRMLGNKLERWNYRLRSKEWRKWYLVKYVEYSHSQ